MKIKLTAIFLLIMMVLSGCASQAKQKEKYGKDVSAIVDETTEILTTAIEDIMITPKTDANRSDLFIDRMSEILTLQVTLNKIKPPKELKEIHEALLDDYSTNMSASALSFSDSMASDDFALFVSATESYRIAREGLLPWYDAMGLKPQE